MLSLKRFKSSGAYNSSYKENPQVSIIAGRTIVYNTEDSPEHIIRKISIVIDDDSYDKMSYFTSNDGGITIDQKSITEKTTVIEVSNQAQILITIFFQDEYIQQYGIADVIVDGTLPPGSEQPPGGEEPPENLFYWEETAVMLLLTKPTEDYTLNLKLKSRK